MSITFTPATWVAILAQPDSATRAQALATLLGANSTIEFPDAADAVIRTITVPVWTPGATASGKTPIVPSSYTDAATGSGTPVAAVFKDSTGTEIFRCSCGTDAGNMYRLAADIVAGVPIIAGALQFRVGVPAPGTYKPVSMIEPTISGTAVVGSVLTSTVGTWSGSPVPTITRQWMRMGVPISGATGTTYTAQKADFGSLITLAETATNSAGATTMTTGAIGPIVAAPLQFSPPSLIQVQRGTFVDLKAYVAGGVAPYTVEHDPLPAGSGITISADGVLNVEPAAAIATLAPTAVRVSDSAPVAGDADADWAYRSTLPGTLWAHDFRNDAEFHNFHKGAQGVYGSTVTKPTQLSSYHADLVATPFGASRAIRSKLRGTRVLSNVPAAVVDEIQTWEVEHIERIEDPAGTEYKLMVNTTEYVWVQSIDVQASTITVRRTKTNGYDGTTTTVMIGSGAQGRWIRPMCALPAMENGRTDPDPGMVNGAARKTNRMVWNPDDANMHVKFREGYFGHRSYWDSAYGEALYKDWTPKDQYNALRTDVYEGDEFWLQFRARVSPSLAIGGITPGPKMIYIQNLSTSGSAQMFWNAGSQDQYMGGVPLDWPYGPDYGNLFSVQRDGGDSRATFGATLNVRGSDGKLYRQYQPEWPESDGARLRGWCIPSGQWVTYLVHMKMGRNSIDKIGVVSGGLLQELPARLFADKTTDTIYLPDVSMFPDVEGPGNYQYIVHTGKPPSENTGTVELQEYMTVLAIDRQANTLTVRRNTGRAWSSIQSVLNENLGWPVGAKIAYGIVVKDDVYPGMGGYFYPPDAATDPRVGYPETTVEIFAAVDGDTTYRTLISYDQYKWGYGDSIGNYTYLYYNPPGINSIELSIYANDYINQAGGVRVADGVFDIQYTQAIFSRNFIPVPTA